MHDDGQKDGRASAPRLRSSTDIQRVLANGARLTGRRVVVCLVRAEEADGPPRAAWVAGRKVGGAVKRNRARRLLREAWRSVAPRVADGWDVVLVARAGIRAATAGEVLKEVEGLLERGEVIS